MTRRVIAPVGVKGSHKGLGTMEPGGGDTKNFLLIKIFSNRIILKDGQKNRYLDRYILIFIYKYLY